MADPVRFYFDNHMPKVVAAGLRAQGVDVQTAHQAGRSRVPDPELIRLATIDGRVVVTQDDDFKGHAADFQTRGEPFAGIVYCDPEVYTIRYGLLIQNLLILHGVYTADDMRDRLEYL
ncbi:MAG: DUF5615 family PIN-like protein [Gemmataceae bacterium]